ncbi:hypothetical protein QUB80_16945 [Chlorogloeopsis sp. ULAP01]|uniref:hypothetical protein n=1 Tax=Chlorogloeopsis sp. ULAP01 TaxID=3056483 RepID=UPI0025AA62FE|nr:hypothetical protein [Chlorogloeopsis sp. ULAP01]MDM9382391.1 hypothetical protein [Chlorogloeopsis sp. ULAP01]
MPIWYYADSTISWRSWRLSGTLRVRQFTTPVATLREAALTGVYKSAKPPNALAPLCRGTLSPVTCGGKPSRSAGSPPDWLTASRLR